jgi:predicted ATPase/DNA-binding SARP family transcriptional activator
MLSVLGSLELGEGSALRSRAQRVIVAALVLDAGAVVTADRLAELVWGDDQPADASGALQSHVSRLRRLLSAGTEVIAEGSGYLLHAPDDEIDVAQFEDSFQQACRSSDDTSRLMAAETGLALWRGFPYPDLDDTRAAGERVRLVEVHDSLVEFKAESLVRLGRPHEAIGSLEALRVENPLRERAIEWLMRAYVDSGRKTDALDAFKQLRVELVDQTGLDPAPALRDLETAIITEEYVGFPSAAVDLPSGSARTITLPASAFLGRDHDVAALLGLLGESRIVSLVGPGGVGKTRMALHTAAGAVSFDGVVDVIELASLRNGDQLADLVATSLSIQHQANATPTERVIDATGNRRRLIVLDNCEHVIEDAAQFVDAVVRGTPHVAFLITSREPLNIDAEFIFRVEPLSVDGSAVELFADRVAGMERGTLVDDTTRPIVEQICRSLDGLPLAIELAAAQIGSMTLEEIAAGVGQPLDMLQRGRRTADERHRSLRDLVQWSLRELDPTQLSAFTASAAFAGPFTASAVAWVTEQERPNIAAALADLVDRSLVVVDKGSGSIARFTMLETIRACAAELLAESDRAGRIGERHDDWVLGLVDGIGSDLGRWAEAESSRVVAVHLADLRVAHQRFHSSGDADRALRLAAELHYAAYYGMHGELFGWITETAERFGASGHPAAETVLASASTGAWQAGDLTAAADYAFRAARAIHPGTAGAGSAAAEARADVARFSDDHETSRQMYARAVELAREDGNVPRIVTNLADGAMIAGYLGDIEAARVAIREARRLVGPDGPLTCRAWLEYAEGEAIADHDPDEAILFLERAADLAERIRAAFIIGVTRLTLTNLQVRGGDPAAAIPGLIVLIEHWRTRGARLQQWITMRSVVDLFMRLDTPRDAAAVLGAVIGSDTASEDTGADAERLMLARRTILTDVPDAEHVLATWAERDQEAIVDHTLLRLRAMDPL